MITCVRTLEEALKSLLLGTHVNQGDDILRGLEGFHPNLVFALYQDPSQKLE
jgi:hypothetical protein